MMTDEEKRRDAALKASGAAQMLVEMWPNLLDGLEGMVAQTVARGFTPEQARTIVASVFAGQRGQQG